MSGAPTARLGRRRPKLTPARVVSLGFATAIAVGTMLLLLPAASQPGVDTTALQSLFTATSATCLTGLIVVDTPTHWSGFGQGVILGLIQAGGLGIMTMASLVGLLLANRIGLRARLNAAAEVAASGLGDVRSVIVGVVRMSVLIETVVAALLTARFALGYDEPLPRALWLGVFHSISAFNNAGFALYSANMIDFADRSVDLCAPDGGGGARRDRVSGVVRDRPTPAPPVARMESAHQADGEHDGAAAGRRPVRGAAAGMDLHAAATSVSGRSCSSRRFRG